MRKRVRGVEPLVTALPVQGVAARALRGDVAGRRRAGTRFVSGLLVLAGLSLPGGFEVRAGEPYPFRWLHLRVNFNNEKEAKDAILLVEQASELGFNGVVVSDPKFLMLELWRLDAPGAAYRQRLERFVQVCRARGLEIVPRIAALSGAGGCMLQAYDPNLRGSARRRSGSSAT